MADIQANGTNWNAIFGEAADDLDAAMDGFDRDKWYGKEGVLTRHFYKVDGLSYTGGSDKGHPDLTLNSCLVNRRRGRPYSIYAHDKSGLKSPNFAETMGQYMIGKTSMNSDLVKALNDQDAIGKFVELWALNNGVQKTDRFLGTDDVYTATQDSFNGYAVEEKRIMAPIMMAILDYNGYITNYAEMKTIHIETETGVKLDHFEKAFVAHELSKSLGTVGLDMGDANLSTSNRERIRPRTIVSSLITVCARIAMHVMQAYNYRTMVRTALHYVYKIAEGAIEDVPMSVQAQALTLASNWTLIEYGAQLTPSKIKAQEYMAVESIQLLTEFLQQSEIIEVMRATELAQHVRVAVTRDIENGFVESVIMDTRHNRQEGRDVFYKAGKIGPFSKLYVEPAVKSGIDGLFKGNEEVLPHEQVRNGLIDTMANVSYANRLVMDFTAATDYDRNLFATAVAVTRAKKVRYIHANDRRDEKRAAISLVFYVKPTERLTAAAAPANLLDEIRTIDPREVIALTGETSDSMVERPGFDATLKLDGANLNYVDVSEVKLMQELSKPLYTTEIDVNGFMPFEVTTTPMHMLDLGDRDEVYSTFSSTNYEDDILTIRMYMASWMTLRLQEEQTPNEKAIEVFKINMARTVMTHMVELTLNNSIASMSTDSLVREFANRQGVTRSYGRFYSDERIMLVIRMYVASVLMIHLSGASQDEIKALHKIVTDTNILTRSLGTKVVESLSRNSTRV